jgi:hypothetical protein
MRFYDFLKARRTPVQRGGWSSQRLILERLEDRLVPSIVDGTVLVCTGPSSYSSLSQSSFPIGVMGVDPTTGAQFPVSVDSGQDGTIFVLPTYVTEAPNGQLYVTDLQAFGTGAIIRVDPNTGQQFLVTQGQLINGPNALAWVNGLLYVANEGDASGQVHTLVQVDPNSGAQTLITDGSGGPGFTVPTGMAAGPGNTVYVSDEPGGYNGPVPGGVWQVDLSTGQQTLITWGNLINHPVDVAQDQNGNLIVIGNAVADPSTQRAQIIRVNPVSPDPTGMNQTLVYTEGAGYPLDGITEDLNSGMIFTGSISYSTNPAELFAINPTTQTQSTLATGGNLSLIEGIRVYHPVTQTAATTTTVAPSLNPSAVGQTVAFTATVSVQSPNSGTPTGTVQFLIDGLNAGNPVAVATSNGVTTASFSTSTLSAGTHTFAALYGGDSQFAPSIGLLAGGEVVNVATNGAGGNVTATLNPSSGVLTISGDTGNNSITLQQTASGVLQLAGAGTLINQSSNTEIFNFSSITEIDISLLNGNDSVTIMGFGSPVKISIQAGSGADSFSLAKLTTAAIHISAAGPAADTISLNNIVAGPVSISMGDNASISLSGVSSSGLVNLAAGRNATVSVNNVTAGGDLDAMLGDSARSLTVDGSSVASLNINQMGSTGGTLFDLENDTVKSNLNLNSGDGNDTITLSHVKVQAELLMILGAGNNTVKADHVVALFGFMNGGTSGNNNYLDGGGNSGYSVFNFIGH